MKDLLMTVKQHNFKGRLSLKQYMSLKQVYKVWVLTYSTQDYLYHFEIFTGKQYASTAKRKLHISVVKRLTAYLSGTKCDVTFDNLSTHERFICRVDLQHKKSPTNQKNKISEMTKRNKKRRNMISSSVCVTIHIVFSGTI